MTKYLILLSAIIFGLTACSDGGGSKADIDSSSSAASSSGTSDIQRMDNAYLDTLPSGDTLSLSIPDSLKTVKVYLGEFPAGTRITLASLVSGITGDTLFVKKEAISITAHDSVYVTKVDSTGDSSTVSKDSATTTYFTGEPLPATKPVVENGDSVYRAYTYPGTSSKPASNTFLTDTTGFYYAELSGTFGAKAKLTLSAQIDTAYYGFTGKDTSASIATGDTLRGFFKIGSGAKGLSIVLKAGTGYSVNVLVRGSKSPSSYALLDTIALLDSNSKVISSDTDTLNELLLPKGDDKWKIRIRPISIQGYWTGPFSYFETIITGRKLGKGEYFADPDSIQKVGDTLTTVRTKNEAAKYYLRQDQYVWLGNFKAGDSLRYSYSVEGWDNGTSTSYTLLNGSGDSVASLSSLSGYRTTAAGAYYLHYTRFGSSPEDNSQTLTLRTFLQRPGYVDSIALYDEQTGKLYTPVIAVGDTLRFSGISVTIAPDDASDGIFWYIPCSDLNVIAYNSSVSCGTSEKEYPIGTSYIVGLKDGTATLIAESRADPLKRDTLRVTVTP